MADMPLVIWRPVPVKEIAIRRLPIPVPLHGFPQAGNTRPDLNFSASVPVKKLAGCQQSLDHECRFNQVTSVVIFPEEWDHFAGAPIQEVRPGAVKAIG